MSAALPRHNPSNFAGYFDCLGRASEENSVLSETAGEPVSSWDGYRNSAPR